MCSRLILVHELSTILTNRLSTFDFDRDPWSEKGRLRLAPATPPESESSAATSLFVDERHSPSEKGSLLNPTRPGRSMKSRRETGIRDVLRRNLRFTGSGTEYYFRSARFVREQDFRNSPGGLRSCQERGLRSSKAFILKNGRPVKQKPGNESWVGGFSHRYRPVTCSPLAIRASFKNVV